MQMRRLLLAALVAAGCVALAGLPAWASAKAGSAGHSLEIDSLRVGSKAGPVAIRVQAGLGAKVAMRVNGKPVRHPFEFDGRHMKQIELRRGDGLVAGANKLRIRSQVGARTLTATRTVKLTALDLLADAGSDTGATVRVRTRVGTAPAVGGGAAAPGYSWRIVKGPARFKASLRGAHTSQPVLRAKTAGVYVLQLRVDPDGPGPVSFDQVTVSAAPNDPPIGAPINTIGGNGAIVIAGASYGANTVGGARSAYVVLGRTTREPALDADGKAVAGSVANDADGMKKLTGLAKTYGSGANAMRYLMIVSGAGLPAAQADEFGRLAKGLGVAVPSEGEFAALKKGRQYSLIGIPGSPSGAGTVRIPGDGSPTASGAITGFLQKLQTVDFDGTPAYNYVSPENPTFDTRSASTATSNTMTIRGRAFPMSLPAGATAGFHLMVMESLTLRDILNITVATNASTGSDRELQAKAAKSLKDIIGFPASTLVFVQSIGKPKAAGPEWAGVVDQLARLGANRVLVNALDGTTEYALVGRLDSQQPAIESSTAFDSGPAGDPKYPPARLVGALSRARNSVFTPTVSSTPTAENPNGMVNLGLISLAYQDGRGFPDLAEKAVPPAKPGEGRAAEQYICKKLLFCQPTNSCPDMRSCYWQKYGGATVWGDVNSNINSIGFPGKGEGFEETTFAAVKAQLLTETAALASVKSYLTQLQDPLEKSQSTAFVDLDSISQKVWESLQRPAGSNKTSWVLGVIGKAMALGGFAAPPVSSAAAGLAATFGLASYLSNETGQPILGSRVKVEASKLGSQLVERLGLARQESVGIGKLIASDYGKLIDARQHIATDWALSDNPLSVSTPLRTASRQWFYETLVPVAYPYLIRGNNNARNLDCKLGGGARAWPNQPDSAQMWVTVGYDNNGNPIKGMYFFAQGVGGGSSPPDSLAQEMFKPRNLGGLGMEKLNFFSPQVFGGKVAHAVNTGRKCELGAMPEIK